MRKLLLTLCLAIIAVITASAQPKSIHYQKEDFFMDVIYNPNASIYDFLVAGLSSKNTELKDFRLYAKSREVQDKCRKLNVSISTAYNKIKASWKVFLEVENSDLSVMSYYYNIFTPRNRRNPELRHKLSIVPLKLEEY